MQDEIVFYPMACVDPFRPNGTVALRLCVEHKREPQAHAHPVCGWSVAYEAEPDNRIAWERVKADVEKHLAECPLKVVEIARGFESAAINGGVPYAVGFRNMREGRTYVKVGEAMLSAPLIRLLFIANGEGDREPGKPILATDWADLADQGLIERDTRVTTELGRAAVAEIKAHAPEGDARG